MSIPIQQKMISMFDHHVSNTQIEILKIYLESEEHVVNCTIRTCEVEIENNKYISSPSFNQESYDIAIDILEKASPTKEIYFNQIVDNFYKYKSLALNNKDIEEIFKKRRNTIESARRYLKSNPSIEVYFYNRMDKFGYKYLSNIIRDEG